MTDDDRLKTERLRKTIATCSKMYDFRRPNPQNFHGLHSISLCWRRKLACTCSNALTLAVHVRASVPASFDTRKFKILHKCM